MLTKHLTGINWVDLLILGTVLRMCYIGIRTGTGIELFKLLSLWFVTVIAFHVYTTPLSDYLNAKLPALPLDAGDFFVFGVLVTVVTILFRIIRESFFLLVKIEAKNTLDKWMALALGCLRGFWVASIALYIMTISTIQYLEVSVKSSLFGSRVLRMAPAIYENSVTGLLNKILPYGEPNGEVERTLER
ncbi:MAG: CvpA family protein [Deltaproteobacteria bacterium]